MNQRKNRFLRGRERASLKVISKGHKTGRARMFGGCREPIAVKWAVVSFQEERTETRRVARDAVAPGRGSVREERARVSQIAQHWPPQLRSHLLRSELAKGLPFSAALSAVGVRSTQIERTYGTDTLREVFLHEGDADAVTLTFVDGHLESWKREALDLDDMVFDKDLPEGEF
jgi:hypothetical protein